MLAGARRVHRVARLAPTRSLDGRLRREPRCRERLTSLARRKVHAHRPLRMRTTHLSAWHARRRRWVLEDAATRWRSSDRILRPEQHRRLGPDRSKHMRRPLVCAPDFAAAARNDLAEAYQASQLSPALLQNCRARRNLGIAVLRPEHHQHRQPASHRLGHGRRAEAARIARTSEQQRQERLPWVHSRIAHRLRGDLDF